MAFGNADFLWIRAAFVRDILYYHSAEFTKTLKSGLNRFWLAAFAASHFSFVMVMFFAEFSIYYTCNTLLRSIRFFDLLTNLMRTGSGKAGYHTNGNCCDGIVGWET